MSRFNDGAEVEQPHNGEFSGLFSESNGTIFIEFLDDKIKISPTSEFYAIVIN